MKNSLKRYFVLALVLLLFLLPIMASLKNVKALQGGKGGLIALGIFVGISIIYWVVMLYLTKNRKK